MKINKIYKSLLLCVIFLSADKLPGRASAVEQYNIVQGDIIVVNESFPLSSAWNRCIFLNSAVSASQAADGNRYYLFGIDARVDPGIYPLARIRRAGPFYIGWELAAVRVEEMDAIAQKITFTPQQRKKIEMPENNRIRTIIRQRITAPERQALFTGAFQMPAEGRISTPYGARRVIDAWDYSYHRGIDISNARGTPIYAPAGGVVTMVAYDAGIFGNCLLIDHGMGIHSFMLHLDTIAVKEADTVPAGMAIATMGSTGLSTGPHLHWTIYVRNRDVDPFQWIKWSRKLSPREN